jgi:transcription initiation factor IIE alpha subunit
VDAESECSNCNVARILMTVTPFARRCQMRSFECPKCNSVLRIVAFGRRFATEKSIDRALAPKKVRRVVPLPRRWD